MLELVVAALEVVVAALELLDDWAEDELVDELVVLASVELVPSESPQPTNRAQTPSTIAEPKSFFTGYLEGVVGTAAAEPRPAAMPGT